MECSIDWLICCLIHVWLLVRSIDWLFMVNGIELRGIFTLISGKNNFPPFTFKNEMKILAWFSCLSACFKKNFEQPGIWLFMLSKKAAWEWSTTDLFAQLLKNFAPHAIKKWRKILTSRLVFMFQKQMTLSVPWPRTHTWRNTPDWFVCWWRPRCRRAVCTRSTPECPADRPTTYSRSPPQWIGCLFHAWKNMQPPWKCTKKVRISNRNPFFFKKKKIKKKNF